MSTGVGEIGSALLGGDASKDAAEEAANAIRYAADVQKQIYQDQVSRYESVLSAGYKLIGRLRQDAEGGYDMKQSPAAQYELQQGTKAMNRQLAARGLLGGGTAANRLTELSQGVAARDWQNAYSRLVDSLKLGTGAAGAMNQAGSNYGNQVGSTGQNLATIYTNQGNNMMSIYQDAGNKYANNEAAVGRYFASRYGG